MIKESRSDALAVLDDLTPWQDRPLTKAVREAGIKTDIDLNERNLSKNLDFANKLEIPYVLFVGKKELKSKKVKLRDMNSGKENLITLNQVIKKLQ